ncbi:MAG: hypothetical protein RLY14_2384 [Planctomycetota bacterium]|jgi:hypothetical protein
MVKDVISSLDYSVYAETALVVFFLVFLAISIRTFFADHAAMTHQSAMALEEGKEVTRK